MYWDGHARLTRTDTSNFRSHFGGGRAERNFQCRGVLLVWMIVGQGPIVLAEGGGGGLRAVKLETTSQIRSHFC